MSKKPSGCEYRKRKKDEQDKANKHQKINVFFKSTSEISEISLIEAKDASTSSCVSKCNVSDVTIGNKCSDTSEQEQIPYPIPAPASPQPSPSAAASTSGLDNKAKVDVSLDDKINDIASCSIDLDLNNDKSFDNENDVYGIDTKTENKLGLFKTDIGLYRKNDDALLKEEDKTFILNSKPCRPKGPFPKDPTSNRSFSSDFYYKTTKTGQKLERFWLCYSPSLNGVYCEACWLFADRTDPKFKNAWCKGLINDWQGLSKKIKDHESSHIHLSSCVTYSAVKNRRDVKSLIERDEPKWCEILKRLLDVIITMATCNLAFRGHRNENIKTVNTTSGNFLNIVDLLSRYDPLLKTHLDNDQSKVKYLSPDIQNEMISFASNHVLNNIISEIQTAPFFSLILDTTQDISKTDQLSIVVRHVSVDGNENKLTIQESFLGFIAITNQGAENITNEVCSFLEKNNIPIEKCRGQGYDGAAVMSGEYTGLQSRIKEKSQNAEYVHCASHNLNLVLNDSVSDITEMIVFYDLINQIYVFFSESLPRWQSLKDRPASPSHESCMVSKTLKRLCPTRWSSRYDCLLAVKCNFTSVLCCLTNIILTSSKSREVVEATAIKKQMTSFQFVLMLVFQSKVLERINVTSKTLQKEDVSIDEAIVLLDSSLTQLKDMRKNEFEVIVKEAKTLAEGWNIETSLATKRSKKVKTFFDELTKDTEFSDPLHKFKVNVFYRSLDTIIGQIDRRFDSMTKINEHFIFLTPAYLTERTDNQLLISARKFCDKYEADVSHALETQIVSFKNIASKDIKSRNMTKVKQLARFLMIENNTLSSSLPDVCTAMLMFLTLPVTSASAERFVNYRIT